MSLDWKVLKPVDKTALALAVETEFNTKVKAIADNKLDLKASEVRNFFYGRLNTRQYDDVDEKMLYAYEETYNRFPGLYNIRTLSELRRKIA